MTTSNNPENLPPELVDLILKVDAKPNAGTLPLERVYAKAIYDAATNAGKADVLVDQFSQLVTGVLDGHPKLEQILGSVRIKAPEKEAMLDRLFAGKFDPLALNALKVIARHERLGLLRRIVRQVLKLHGEAQNLVRVEVTTAVPLSEEHLARLRETARRQLQAEPFMVVRTDPSMIGGLTIRVGDTLYDGTVAARLAQLREDMIQRTVHAIQSGRDRFSHPSGN